MAEYFATFETLELRPQTVVTFGRKAATAADVNSDDMHKHTHGDSAQAAVLTDEFIDDYAAAGTPERVIEKLSALKTLGLSKVVLSGSWRSAADASGPESKRLAEDEVLPALRD